MEGMGDRSLRKRRNRKNIRRIGKVGGRQRKGGKVLIGRDFNARTAKEGGGVKRVRRIKR